MKWIAVLILVIGITGCGQPPREEVLISAAASLSQGMEEIGKMYEADTGVRVIINTGGSGALKKQVEEGAPVDFIFLASKRDIDELVTEGLIEGARDLLENTLVVVGEKKIDDLREIEGLLVMGDPDFVPAGRYGREALVKRGIWERVQENLLITKDVTAALAYAQRGEVDYSIVYRTDAMRLKDKEVYIIEDGLHTPIVYSAGAAIGSSQGKEFYEYLIEKIEVFEKYGFKVRDDDSRSN